MVTGITIKKGKRVERSVFAGVERNSLSFQDIQKLQAGGKLNIKIPSRFFKSLINLNISIKPIELLIVKNNPKLFFANRLRL